MKKYSALVLIIVLVLQALTGCSSEKNFSNEEEVTVTLWHYYNGNTKDSFDALVQKFNETVGKEKKILVDAYSYSGVNELADALNMSADKEIGAPPLPDVFSAYSDNAYLLDKKEIVAPLDKYFSEEDLKKFNKEFLNEGRFDAEKSLKIIPIAKSTENLYINTTDFNIFADETGANIEDMATWEGIVKLSAMYYEYTDAKTIELFDGKSLFGIDSFANFFTIVAKQLGNDIYNNNNGKIEFNLNYKTAKQLWDTLYKSSVSGYFSIAGRFRSDDVKSGEILAYVGSTASANYFPETVEKQKDSAYEIDFAVMIYPIFANSDKVAVSQGAGMVVTKSTEEKERSAVEFLKWFTTKEQNTEFAVSTGYIPVQTESMNYENIISFMDKLPKVNPIVLETAEITYNGMKDYTLYASIPFGKSYEARKLLEDTLKDKINADIEILAKLKPKERGTAIQKLCSDDNFEVWYADLTKKMNGLVK